MERKYSTMTISLPQTHDSVALRYTLERLAYKLGYTQGQHGVRSGRGSIGKMLEAIASGSLKVIRTE